MPMSLQFGLQLSRPQSGLQLSRPQSGLQSSRPQAGLRSRPRFGVVIALGALLALPAAALAQTASPPDWVHPPADLPRVDRGDPKFSLDTLFEALKVAPDEDSAKAIEQRIWAAWTASGSDTCNILMNRVKVATGEKDFDLAIKLLDAVIDIKPDYVEAWNERATVFYLKDDFGHALADISEVLVREPRHFAALSGLGLILQELGDDKDALNAYRKALAIDPHLDHVADVVKTLAEKVEGQDI
jgi:tetratricopeptide (TPR) repeat protein